MSGKNKPHQYSVDLQSIIVEANSAEEAQQKVVDGLKNGEYEAAIDQVVDEGAVDE